MAALNYSLYVEEASSGGDTGSGPYIVTLRKNPTTAPSGGTLLATFKAASGGVNTSGANTQNVRELTSQAMNWLSNNISMAVQTDTNN